MCQVNSDRKFRRFIVIVFLFTSCGVMATEGLENYMGGIFKEFHSVASVGTIIIF